MAPWKRICLHKRMKYGSIIRQVFLILSAVHVTTCLSLLCINCNLHPSDSEWQWKVDSVADYLIDFLTDWLTCQKTRWLAYSLMNCKFRCIFKDVTQISVLARQNRSRLAHQHFKGFNNIVILLILFHAVVCVVYFSVCPRQIGGPVEHEFWQMYTHTIS